MTATHTPAPTPSSRLRWMLSDTWTLTRRNLDRWVREPAPLLLGLLFPVLMVLMFGYLFGGAMIVPGGGEYLEFLLPGMFAMTMLFGVEGTMVAVADDANRGITDRLRSLPVSAAATVAGRAVADMVNAALALTVMLGCGLLVGWQAHHGAPAALAAAGLLLLLRFSLVWVGVYLGLLARNPQTVAAVQILVWPLGFLSNTFVDPATMPGWLGAVARWNPLSATVSATRELFGNPGWSGAAWTDQHAVPMAVAWPLLITAVFGILAARRYRSLSR